MNANRGRETTLLRIAVYLLIIGIVAADWATPAGIVVGILLAVPILLASLDDDRRQVIVATVIALVGFFVAALFGEGPISPRSVWLPNRLFVGVSLLASCPLALRLQRERLTAEAERRAAEASRDLSRLLHSLMAHDLRAPLAMATHALELARTSSPDLSLLEDAQHGLRRSLGSIDRVLAAARTAIAQPQEDTDTATGDAAAPALVIESIVGGIEDVAQARGQVLHLELQDSVREKISVDVVVLEHALSILLDNAVRYAEPGPIYVGANVAGAALSVGVADSGPGYSANRARPHPARGAGLGLELARLLVANAGGTLSLEHDGPTGSEFVIRLPLRPLSGHAKRGGAMRPRPLSVPSAE